MYHGIEEDSCGPHIVVMMKSHCCQNLCLKAQRDFVPEGGRQGVFLADQRRGTFPKSCCKSNVNEGLDRHRGDGVLNREGAVQKPEAAGWVKETQYIDQVDRKPMTLKVGWTTSAHKFYVVLNFCGEMSLGGDWLHEQGAKVNFNPSVLTVSGVEVPFDEDIKSPPRTAETGK